MQISKNIEQFKKATNVRDVKQKNEFDAKDKKQFLKGAEIAYETILTAVEPTTDNTVSVPNSSGVLATEGNALACSNVFGGE